VVPLELPVGATVCPDERMTSAFVAAEAGSGAMNGAAIAPIMTMGRKIRTKRFIVIHLSLGSLRLTESYAKDR
jgi:hypothetical protein